MRIYIVLVYCYSMRKGESCRVDRVYLKRKAAERRATLLSRFFGDIQKDVSGCYLFDFDGNNYTSHVITKTLKGTCL